jgi:hypothetical protein
LEGGNVPQCQCNDACEKIYIKKMKNNEYIGSMAHVLDGSRVNRAVDTSWLEAKINCMIVTFHICYRDLIRYR